jgi:hypothetical protein
VGQIIQRIEINCFCLDLMWYAGSCGRREIKWAIEKEVVKSPRVLIFQIISLMQQWRILLPESEQKVVQGAAEALKLKMRQSR